MTNPFYDMIYRFSYEPLRQFDFWHFHAIDTECSPTYFTMEVRVCVVVVITVMAVAQFVFHPAAAVLYDMHKMQLLEKH